MRGMSHGARPHEDPGPLGSGELRVPLGHSTATMFIDESGSKGSGSAFFVLGLVKLRRPGELARTVIAIRDRHRFRQEFKFGNVTAGALPAYFDLADAIAASDALIGAYIYDKQRYDPFPGEALWRVQAGAASRLVHGNLNRGELVSVMLDLVSSPEGVAVDERVRQSVNGRVRRTAVVSALCLDSRTSDCLQAADLVASAIAFERHAWAGRSKHPPGARTPKARLAQRLRVAFGLPDFGDVRTSRVNIHTERARSPRART